jgi:ribose 1,5-bisphosphokinase PhnN
MLAWQVWKLADGLGTRYFEAIINCREIAMSQKIGFADVLDAAEQLDDNAQIELIDVLSRRLAERGRERLATVVEQARREFAAGQCQPMTAAELIREARS